MARQSKSFIGSIISLDVTHFDATVIPVKPTNLSPIAYPPPVSTVVESGTNRCDTNGIFSREEFDSDRLLRNILPHGDDLRCSWLEDSHFSKCLMITEFLLGTSSRSTYLVRA